MSSDDDDVYSESDSSSDDAASREGGGVGGGGGHDVTASSASGGGGQGAAAKKVKNASTSNAGGKGSKWLSFDAARAIVRALKLGSWTEWKDYSKSGKRPSNIPGAPQQVYRDAGWVSTADWLGYGK